MSPQVYHTTSAPLQQQHFQLDLADAGASCQANAKAVLWSSDLLGLAHDPPRQAVAAYQGTMPSLWLSVGKILPSPIQRFLFRRRGLFWFRFGAF